MRRQRFAVRLIVDDLSYYLGRLVCSLGFHSCENTEAQLSAGNVAFWVLIGVVFLGGMAFSHQIIHVPVRVRIIFVILSLGPTSAPNPRQILWKIYCYLYRC